MPQNSTGHASGKNGLEVRKRGAEEIAPPAWASQAVSTSRGMLRPSLSLGDYQAHGEFIAGAVYSLLAHYFDPKHANDVIEITAADWVDTLEPFSAECITEARRRWIANETRRPVPADIKKLCFQIVAGK